MVLERTWGMPLALFLWLLEGAITGWLSTLLVRDEADRRFFQSVFAGMVGSFVGGLGWGLFVSSNISPGSLAVSFIGALIAVAAATLFQQNSSR